MVVYEALEFRASFPNFGLEIQLIASCSSLMVELLYDFSPKQTHTPSLNWISS